MAISTNESGIHWGGQNGNRKNHSSCKSFHQAFASWVSWSSTYQIRYRGEERKESWLFTCVASHLEDCFNAVDIYPI